MMACRVIVYHRISHIELRHSMIQSIIMMRMMAMNVQTLPLMNCRLVPSQQYNNNSESPISRSSIPIITTTIQVILINISSIPTCNLQDHQCTARSSSRWCASNLCHTRWLNRCRRSSHTIINIRMFLHNSSTI